MTAREGLTEVFNDAGASIGFASALRVRDAALANGLLRLPPSSGGSICVSMLATGGAGTTISPYTGWDAAIGTFAANTTYLFDAGKVFAHSSPLVVQDVNNCRFVGNGPGSSTTKFTGTGKAISFKASGVGAIFGCCIENLTIKGNSNATEGLYTESSHHMTISNVDVRDVSQTAVHVKFCVLSTFKNLRVSHNEGAFAVTPVTGFLTEARGGGETFQANTIDNLIIEGVSGDGVYLVDAWQNTFTGGSSEGNGGRGVYIDSTCRANTFTGTDCEANGGKDFEINGLFNTFDGILSSGLTTVRSGSVKAMVRGGQFEDLVIEAGAIYPTVDSISFNVNGSGSFSNSSSTITILGALTDITAASSGGGMYLAANPVHIVDPTQLSTAVWDTANIRVLELGGAASIAADVGNSTPTIRYTLNAYVDSGGTWRYRVAGKRAVDMYMQDGALVVLTAPAGAAVGDPITWTEIAGFGNDGKLYINDAGTPKAVTYGANDSGGAGYKVLRVPN